MDAKKRQRLAALVAGYRKAPTSVDAAIEATAAEPATSPKRETHARARNRTGLPTAVEYAVFPPRDAGAVARQHIAGVSPFTDTVVDTTTVAGMGLAQLHLDPLAEVYCARIGHHHPDGGDHGLPHGFLGDHGHDGDGHG